MLFVFDRLRHITWTRNVGTRRLVCAFFGLRQVYFHLHGEEYVGLSFKSPMLYKYCRHPIMLGWMSIAAGINPAVWNSTGPTIPLPERCDRLIW